MDLLYLAVTQIISPINKCTKLKLINHFWVLFSHWKYNFVDFARSLIDIAYVNINKSLCMN